MAEQENEKFKHPVLSDEEIRSMDAAAAHIVCRSLLRRLPAEREELEFVQECIVNHLLSDRQLARLGEERADLSSAAE